MKKIYKRRSAFTMLEMVLGIVVISILASLAIPRTERDLRAEAKTDIISALRYTQHMALIDDKMDPFDPIWQSKLWNISFSADGSNYTISSDGNFAVDSSDGKLLDGTATGSPKTHLSKRYGINSITNAGGCTGRQIAFDILGRPYNGVGAIVGGSAVNYANYMTSDCTLTVAFTQSDINNLVITIAQETGTVSSN